MNAATLLHGGGSGGGGGLPAIPTRAQACAIQMSFQGLMVTLWGEPETPWVQPGVTIPWFESALAALGPQNRKAVYLAKQAAGDTHAIIGYQPGGMLYPEPGQPYVNYPMPNFVADPTAFIDLIVEVLQAGFIPCVFFNGASYAAELDPLETMLAALITNQTGVDLTQYCPHSPGYDGVFYGWLPPQIAAYGKRFRDLGGRYLMLEHNAGQLPLGGGPADYAPGGPMDAYDVILSEYAWWANGALPGPQLWQIAARLLGPAYVWPPDEPANEDGHPPPYYAIDCSRGPRYKIAFEYGTYPFVHGFAGGSLADIARMKGYLKRAGYTYVC